MICSNIISFWALLIGLNLIQIINVEIRAVKNSNRVVKSFTFRNGFLRYTFLHSLIYLRLNFWIFSSPLYHYYYTKCVALLTWNFWKMFLSFKPFLNNFDVLFQIYMRFTIGCQNLFEFLIPIPKKQKIILHVYTYRELKNIGNENYNESCQWLEMNLHCR